ncbi:hypothetical protein PG991_001744 [Apiospora marii]|uniref:Uncharacterized protein n=1 Tax=Apiospora marii TaxID=335849 RepID=A0ABR1SQY4_9PEZI
MTGSSPISLTRGAGAPQYFGSTPYGVRQESESWNGLAAVPPGRPRGFQYRVADSLVDDALVDDALVADSFVDDLGI